MMNYYAQSNHVKEEMQKLYSHWFKLKINKSESVKLSDLIFYAHETQKVDDETIISFFDSILDEYKDNPELVIKALFFIRDPRHGLGERRFFRVVLKHLALTHPEYIRGVLNYRSTFTVLNGPLIPYYGRWDDMWVLLDTPFENDVYNIIRRQLQSDIESINTFKRPASLLAKWLPSISSGKKSRCMANKIAKALGMSAKEYRQTISRCRQNMKYTKNQMIDFATEYADSKDQTYYKLFVDWMSMVRNISKRDQYQMQIINHNWETLVCPSASILVLPNPYIWQHNLGNWMGSINMFDFAIASGVYFSRQLYGPFKNSMLIQSKNEYLSHTLYHFTNPRDLQFFDMTDISDNVSSFFNSGKFTCVDWTLNVYSDLLSIAIKNNANPMDIPQYILYITDKNHDLIIDPLDLLEVKQRYEEAGYKPPMIICWILNEHVNPIPYTDDKMNITYIHGCSDRIIENIRNGKINGNRALEDELNGNHWLPVSIAFKHGILNEGIHTANSSNVCENCKYNKHSGN